MPNWCDNYVTITGPSDAINELWYKSKETIIVEGNEQERGFLNTLRPQPEFDKAKPDNSLMPDWWTWRVNNWGTKWDVDPSDLVLEDNGDTSTISGYIESAWSPPVEAFNDLVSNNPDVSVEMHYHEPGMAFVGVAQSDSGAMVDSSYEYSDMESLDYIPEDVVEYWDLRNYLEDILEEEVDIQHSSATIVLQLVAEMGLATNCKKEVDIYYTDVKLYTR